MKRPILYESNATDFFNLGLGVLTEAKSTLVTEERNGQFTLEMDYPLDGKAFNELKNNRIIKADAGHELKEQRFRIKRITKPMKGYVKVYAEHIRYEANDLPLQPEVTIRDADAQSALNRWQQSIVGDYKPFSLTSNITTRNGTSWSIREVENAGQALAGVKGSILDIWGGEYKFDNYHISLLRERGRQANAMIAYGRNLTDFEQEENIMDTYTSIYPYAVWRDDEGDDHLITIPELVVDSEYVDNYPNQKVLPIDFTIEFDQEERPTPDELRELAERYITQNEVGVPRVSIRLSYLDLSKTLDFKDNPQVEQLNLCDNVRIFFEKLGIQTTAKIVKVIWNVHLERYEELEIGEVRTSLSERLNRIDSQVREARKEADDARNIAMVSSNGINMTFFGPDEPIATKVGDTWYMEDGTHTILKIWDGVIWRRVIGTDDLNKMEQEVEKVIEDAEQDRKNTQQAIEQTLSDAKHYTEQKSEEFRIEFNSQLDEVRDIAVTAPDQIAEAIQRAGFGSSLGDLTDRVIELSSEAERTASLAYDEALRAYNATGQLETKVIGMESKVDEVEGSITNRVWQTDISEALEGVEGSVIDHVQTEFNQTFESFEQSIVRVESDLNGKVSTTDFNILQSDVDRTINRIGTAEGRLNTVESTANGTQQTVSGPNGLTTQISTLSEGFDVLSTSFDNLEVGGRNLLHNSFYELRSANSSGWGDARYPDDSGDNMLSKGIVEKGKTYTLSQYLVADSHGVCVQIRVPSPSNQVRDFRGNYIPAGEEGISQVTFTIPEDATGNVRVMVIRFGQSGTPAQTVRWGRTKLEEGSVRTDWSPAPEDMATKAQLSVLSNEIDMAVSNGDVIGRINVQAGRTLLQNNTLVMSANTTVFTGSAFIPDASIIELRADKVYGTEAQFATIRSRVLITNAVTATHIQSSNALIDKIFASSALINRLTSMQAFINSIRAIDISADRITTGTLNAAIVRAITLDVSQIAGNRTDFVQSFWNSVSSQVEIVGEGVRSTASDGSQALVQNGVFLSRNNSGSTVGYLGYSQLSGSPWYRLQTTLGANFEIRGIVSGGSNRQMMSFYPQSNEIYMHPSNLYMVGRINAQSGITSSGTLHMGGNTITQVSQINLLHGGYLNSLSSNSELRLRSSGGRMQIGTSGSWAIVIDNTHVYMHRTLNMQNNQITQQSDMRLKSNIVIDEINSLEAIRAWSFAGFNWKNDSEKGRQFGLLAQGANEIAFKGADGFLNVDSTKQLNMTSHAVQQLDKKVVNIKDYLDKQFEQIAFDNLQRDLEIKRLKERVAQLEKGAS